MSYPQLSGSHCSTYGFADMGFAFKQNHPNAPSAMAAARFSELGFDSPLWSASRERRTVSCRSKSRKAALTNKKSICRELM
jgi:hypothetical protein